MIFLVVSTRFLTAIERNNKLIIYEINMPKVLSFHLSLLLKFKFRRDLFSMKTMKFLPPKKAEKVNWQISEQTRTIVELYAKYTAYSEEEIVDFFMKNLLSDPKFGKFLKAQRRNKRIIDRVFLGDETMGLLYQYIDMDTSDLGNLEDELEEDVDKKHFPRSPDRF